MKANSTTLRAAIFLLVLAAGAVPAPAQQILLEPVRAGELTLFRDLTDEKVYYYVSDKPRLATAADGKPEFSMLRWVENKRSGADEAELREGEGGGIVHALVTLGITREQIQQAQSELQRQRPGGIIRGPVMYKQGTFGLVSSFKDKDSGLVTQKVVGLGKAPILDGQKAAVSFQLTKRGAQVLWESMQTPTPDISFTFEMELAGFHPPARAILEADFEQIYKHTAFAAGIATTHLGAEIEVAFDDLRRTGAIKLTQIGDDAQINSLIGAAYANIAQIMFDSAPDILKPSAGLVPGQLGLGDSMLDKATKLLDSRRAAARESRAKETTAADPKPPATPERTGPAERQPDPAATARTQPTPPDTTKLKQAEKELNAARERLEAAKKAAAEAAAKVKPATEVDEARRSLDEARKQADALKAEASKEGASDEAKKEAQEAADVVSERKGHLDTLEAEASTAQAAHAARTKAVTEAQQEVEKREAAVRTASTDPGPTPATAATRTPAAPPTRGPAPPATATEGKKDEKKDDGPRWAAIASFKMKSIRQRGKLKWDLNKYTESTVTLRFDGNIGDVRQFKDHFREVNLWSPLYQQREVVVYVDGANASDFGQYVNFVTVRLRKRHGGGAVTDDEVLIDRNNFNKEGNRFKLLYGWNGDNDRRRWMEYEYQTVWSLFGGKTVELPMQKATAQAIAVTPPYQRRIVEVRGDAAELTKAEVRSVNVKLFYDLAGAPQVKQATLDVAQPKTSQIEFMTLPESVDYEYEITWRLKGNRTVSSGRQKASDAILQVDDVPLG